LNATRNAGRAQPTKPLKTFKAASSNAPGPVRTWMQKPCSREPPFSARLEATAASSLVAVAHSIAVAVHKTSDGTRCATHTRRVSVVYPPPKGTSSPEQVPFDRIASFPGPEAVKTPPLLPAHDLDRQKPVSPFVVAQSSREDLCPAPPVSTRTDLDCLAEDTAELPLSVY